MTHSKYSVVISSRAETMLVQHVTFLSRVSISAAKKLSVAFQSSLRELEQTPERFPFLVLDGIPTGLYRKCLFYNRYELIFLIIERTVYIDAVRDCRQNPENLIS